MQEILVRYLEDLEDEGPFFNPWDDEDHAARNLMTMFDVSYDEAIAAARAACISVKS